MGHGRGQYLGFIGGLLWASLGAAAPVKSGLNPEPATSLIVLTVAADVSGQARERRFYDELSLVLDDFALYAQAAEKGFVGGSAEAQVSLAEAMAEKEGAVAVAWVTTRGAGRLIVHLVAVQTARVLIRSLEIGARKNPEAVAALTVRELLGTAYLFEPERAKESTALRGVLNKVREEASVVSQPSAKPVVNAVTEAPPPQTAARSMFAGRAGALLAKGPSGVGGSTVRLGGRVVGEWLPLESARFGAALEASTWSSPVTERQWVNGVDVAVGLGFAYGWSWGRFRVVPGAELQLVWEQLTGWTDIGGLQRYQSFKPRGLLGASVSFRLTDRWWLGLGGRAELSLGRVAAQRIDTGEPLASSTWVGWRVELSLERD